MKELFGQPYDKSDPYWVIKGYFDIIYDDDDFIEVAGYIVKRWGFGTDGAHCCFPDEYDDFEGVYFDWGFGDNFEPYSTVTVSEEVCFDHLRKACEIYTRLHPEDTETIANLLRQIPD